MRTGTWALAASLLGAIGLLVLAFGSTVEDPFAGGPMAEAGPLPAWLIPSLYASAGLFVAALLFCLGMLARSYRRRGRI